LWGVMFEMKIYIYIFIFNLFNALIFYFNINNCCLLMLPDKRICIQFHIHICVYTCVLKTDEVRYTIAVKRYNRAAGYKEDVKFLYDVCLAMENSMSIINGRLFRSEARKHANVAIHDICKRWQVFNGLNTHICHIYCCCHQLSPYLSFFIFF
jgi:hypothetical protein